MKLAIVAVYLPLQNGAALLDIHIHYIRKYTPFDFRIYAGVRKDDLSWRKILSEYPEITQQELPVTELNGSRQHSFYLDYLVKIAIQDNRTHIVSLHLDSFPISSRWIQTLKDITDKYDSCVAAEIYYTCCLFFSRSFYLSFQPCFYRVGDLIQYQKFCEKYRLVDHSGTFYLYIATQNYKPFHLLKKLEGKQDEYYGNIFGGLIFHLGGAARHSLEFLFQTQNGSVPSYNQKLKILSNRLFMKLRSYKILKKIWTAVKKILTTSLLNRYFKWLGKQSAIYGDPIEKSKMKREKEHLFNNPEAYFKTLKQLIPKEKIKKESP